MITYTTPTITLIAAGVLITDAEVYVTIAQGSKKLTKTDATLEYTQSDTIVKVTLTQEETGAFEYDREVKVQVNWITDGVRAATKIERVDCFENLLDEVIE